MGPEGVSPSVCPGTQPSTGGRAWNWEPGHSALPLTHRPEGAPLLSRYLSVPIYKWRKHPNLMELCDHLASAFLVSLASHHTFPSIFTLTDSSCGFTML